MRWLRNLQVRCRHSEDTVYIFSELGKRQRAIKAMRFHEMKIAVQVAVCIFIAQMLLLGIIYIFR